MHLILTILLKLVCRHIHLVNSEQSDWLISVKIFRRIGHMGNILNGRTRFNWNLSYAFSGGFLNPPIWLADALPIWLARRFENLSQNPELYPDYLVSTNTTNTAWTWDEVRGSLMLTFDNGFIRLQDGSLDGEVIIALNDNRINQADINHIMTTTSKGVSGYWSIVATNKAGFWSIRQNWGCL